jgi:hypothetical protein
MGFKKMENSLKTSFNNLNEVLERKFTKKNVGRFLRRCLPEAWYRHVLPAIVKKKLKPFT